MTYPGLVLLVGVGVGIATFLYYIFNDNHTDVHEHHQQQQLQQQQQQQQQQRGQGRNRRPSDYRDDWPTTSSRSENVILSRRSSLNSARIKEERDSVTNKEDISNCTICQDTLIGPNVIQVQPCRHKFHTDCVLKLRSYNPRACCPNCRTSFKHII